jgi:sugar (pentulose or hexulose) kinase
MQRFLLIDFGTTSTKSALVDLATGVFSYVQSHPSVPGLPAPGRYEIEPAALTARFQDICDLYVNQLGIPFDGIVLCSEQNGFVALDEENRPLSNYVSWRDERSLEPIDGVATYTLIVERLGDAFKQISGWRPGPGLPIFNAAHLARLSLLPSRCKIVSLPEWLALCSGDGAGVVHDSMLHGLAFYDVQKQALSSELVSAVEELCGVRFAFNQTAPASAVSGYWHGSGGKVPIYAGVGDHQCSVLGACNRPGETTSLNIGTGSQVAVVDPSFTPDASELRPYFDGRTLVAVTRIPGGRALASFIGFLDDVCRDVSGQPFDFWHLLQALEVADVSAGTMDVDLAVFGSAWGFETGGSIRGILEGSFTLQNYLASLLRSFVLQYVTVIGLFDPEHALEQCILSGGVARKMPLLAELVTDLAGYQTLPATDLDESLLGLRTLALVAAGQADTCGAAQQIFGRDCSLYGITHAEGG